MNMTDNRIQFVKKFLITMISWSLLFSPIAYANTERQAQEEQRENEGTQGGHTGGTETAQADTTSSENTDIPSPIEGNDPNYCQKDGTAKQCTESGQVYNCHLESCVAQADNNNYNMEYTNCGENVECLERLKADAQEFTQYKTHGPKNGNNDVLNMLAAASQIGMGCAILGAFGCKSDGIGMSLSGAMMLGMALMKLLGNDYKETFEKIKKDLRALDEKDAKGWNHVTQKAALQTEISMLKLMEDAASDKIKHHTRTMTLITVAAAIAAICAALTIWGCPGTNTCTYPVLITAGIALVLEAAAMSQAKKAKKSASSSRKKAEAVLKKLESRYNNQYNPSTSRQAQMAAANISGQSMGLGMNNNDTSLDINEIQHDSIKKIPKMSVDLGKLGATALNAGKAMNFNDVMDGYNKTAETGNTKYVNKALDANAGNISKVARKILEAGLKNKKADPKARAAISAILDPNSAANRQFLAQQLAAQVSPLGLAMNYRNAGGRNAAGAIANNSKKEAEVEGIAYDSSSKDYLNKLKSQLSDFESLLDTDDSGLMAMKSFNDPTVSEDAVKQLNGGDSKDKKDTIHPDSGLSLWNIITNRYNVIKLKKGFN